MNSYLEFILWSGVFDKFATTTSDTGVFEEDIWLDKSSDRARHAMAEQVRRTFPSGNATTHDYILPAVAASVARRDATLRILDFGGGMAATFFAVADALAPDQRLAFHIVESSALCRRVQKVPLSDERLIFHEALPKAGESMDIVHAGSSLQYVEDWRGLLARLCAYRPSHLVLADVPAGDLPHTFVSGQYYYGKRIAHWFFRMDEFVAAVEGNGYRLVFRAPYIGSYLGERRPLPMDGLPETHRLKTFCQLMFRPI